MNTNMNIFFEAIAIYEFRIVLINITFRAESSDCKDWVVAFL